MLGLLTDVVPRVVHMLHKPPVKLPTVLLILPMPPRVAHTPSMLGLLTDAQPKV